MTNPRIKYYLLAFIAWLAVATAVFYFGYPYYAEAVLFLSERMLGLFTPVSVNLDSLKRMGIALSYPGIQQPMMFRSNLFSVTLNWIFVPALVLTTLMYTTKVRIITRLLSALVLLWVLHAFHVTLILLHFLTGAPNPLIPPDFSSALTSSINWLYSFIDKMGYTLFPFLAWFAVCFKDITSLFDTPEQADSAPKNDAEDDTVTAD